MAPHSGQRSCWVRGDEPGQAKGEGGVRVHSRRKTLSWGHGVGQLLGRAGDWKGGELPLYEQEHGPRSGRGSGEL